VYIFLDTDGAGMATPHSGIVGVTVELMQDEVVIARAVTGADGGYKFENLFAGEYVVQVSNVPNDLVYTCGLHDPQEGTVRVNLGAGENRDDVDVGFAAESVDADQLLTLATLRVGMSTSGLLALRAGVGQLVALRCGEGVWFNPHAL
jgi:hypothetical protein